MNRFCARWLASLEVISQVLFTSEQPKKNKMAFAALWAASYSACVVYTKTIIHLSVDESGGYLPPLWWILLTIILDLSAIPLVRNIVSFVNAHWAKLNLCTYQCYARGGGGGPRDRVGTLIRNKNLESNFLTLGIRFHFKVPHLGEGLACVASIPVGF